MIKQLLNKICNVFRKDKDVEVKVLSVTAWKELSNEKDWLYKFTDEAIDEAVNSKLRYLGTINGVDCFIILS